MKVYTKIILDKNNNVIYEDYYEYEGKWARLGIHYDFKSLSGVRAMKKKAKIAERREKKKSKRKDKEKEDDEKIKIEKGLDPNKALSLDFLTNPNKK